MTKTVCLNRYSNADQCQNISRHWSKNRIFFYRAATESVTNIGKLLTWEIFRAIIKLNHIYAKKQKPHNTDYVVFSFFSRAKVPVFVFVCGIYRRFPSCKYGWCSRLNVPKYPQAALYTFQENKGSCKKMSQIMRKHLFF